MTDKCEICNGARYVRLPRYRPFSMRPFDPDVLPTKPTGPDWKEIACPECNDVRPDENRVTVLHSDCRIQTWGRTVGVEELAAIKKQLAMSLAQEFLHRGLIDFDVRPEGDYRQIAIATLGVVAPAHVATMQERIETAQRPTLAKFAERAADRISVWGRDVGRTTITKDEAVRFINETLREWKP